MSWADFNQDNRRSARAQRSRHAIYAVWMEMCGEAKAIKRASVSAVSVSTTRASRPRAGSLRQNMHSFDCTASSSAKREMSRSSVATSSELESLTVARFTSAPTKTLSPSPRADLCRCQRRRWKNLTTEFQRAQGSVSLHLRVACCKYHRSRRPPRDCLNRAPDPACLEMRA